MNTHGLSAALTAGLVMWMGVAAWAEEPAIIDVSRPYDDEPGVVTLGDRGPSQYAPPQNFSTVTPASVYREQPPVYANPPEMYGPVYTPSEPFCADPGCDDDCCGCIYGASVLFLGGWFDPGNDAFTIRNVGAGGDVIQNRDFDFDDLNNGMRYWAGYVGSSGFGGRITYFELDADVAREAFTAPNANFAIIGPTVPNLPNFASTGTLNAGNSINANANFEMYSIDADLMQALRKGSWDINVGGGFRHASFEQDYVAIVNDAGAGHGSHVSHRFDGVGPTIFAEVRRPIAGSVLNVFAKGRASLLYGDEKFAAQDTILVTNDLSRRSNEVMTISEIQVGGEVCFRVGPCHRLTVHAAWEGQNWAGAGTATSSDGDLGLMGFNAGAGLDW
jgi:hypothetical protein